MRNFVLRDKDGNEQGIFTGKQPRQAALKAANRGKGTKSKPEIIRLRERGQRKYMFSRHGSKLSKLQKISLAGCQKKSTSPLSKKRK